ncbi:MAG: hypothetical protein CEE40_06115 [Chloroflexi bacterium B3_Chlor]|nr:MAG: hypothetical protein CEE40_06115 [Chloroflexi bacterium B3_Chlor]
MLTKGYVSSKLNGSEVTRKQFLEYVLLKGPLCAWWFRNLQESPPQTAPSYEFLNGGCLIANHHEFLFTTDLFWEQLAYYRIMNAKVIRAMATDANHLIPRQLSGVEVGARIALLAPALRLTGIKLMVALTNNHCPIPGDDKYAGNRAQVGDPTRVYYEILEPWFEGGFRENYLPFVKDVITTVQRLGAQDVIFAWEPGNELHTPLNPEKLLSFYRETTAFIKDLDSETLIASGTMGVNHIHPGHPWSPVAQEVYELEGFDIITLHTYDLLLDWDSSTGHYDRAVSAGDMPIDWDFQLIKAMNLGKPVVIEEIGTTGTLRPYWHDPGGLGRLAYETRVIDYTLRNGAIGWGPWSLTTQGERIGDGYRGPCSYPGMSLFETNGQPTDSPRARIEECYRNLPQSPFVTLREKFPHLRI